MGACIYIYSRETSPALEKAGRGGLEDDLNDFMADAGEVTGGGAGEAGWNLDIELSEDEHLQQWTKRVVHFLREWGAPIDIEMDLVEEGWEPGMPKGRIRLADET